jgi:choice-of-anchor B domain-containing protein
LYSEAPAPSSAPLSLDRRERAQGPTRATDHNLFIRGDYVYLANDAAGFRILELVNPATADLEEIAYFDIYPRRDWSGLRGAWTAYPYFDSGIVSISGMEQGLFIVRPDLPGGS